MAAVITYQCFSRAIGAWAGPCSSKCSIFPVAANVKHGIGCFSASPLRCLRTSIICLMRKVILYIASSLDGFIAKPNDDLSFLSIVERPGEDYGYADFVSGVDTVIVGRKTYDWVLKNWEFPHSQRKTYVVTHASRPDEGNISFYSGDLVELVAQLKSAPGKNIFCDGGAQIVNELLRNDLIDEFIISIIPILVGDGVRLFARSELEQKLELISVKNFESGLVQLHYERMRKGIV